MSDFLFTCSFVCLLVCFIVGKMSNRKYESESPKQRQQQILDSGVNDSVALSAEVSVLVSFNHNNFSLKQPFLLSEAHKNT